MSLQALARVALAGDAGPALARGARRARASGQILGPEGSSLLLGTASNLRRWAASHLGLGRPRPAAGGRARRPKTNLAGIATAVALGRDGRAVPPAARSTSGSRRRSSRLARGATSSRRPSSTSTRPSASRA